jgi:hypothetical protein
LVDGDVVMDVIRVLFLYAFALIRC